MPDVKEKINRLELTQNLREEIVSTISSKGIARLDEDSLTVLMTVMNDMDRTELSSKRLGVDSSLAAENAKANQMMLSLLGKLPSDPFRKDTGTTERLLNPADSINIPEPVLVAGETEVGIADHDIDTFLTEFTPED